jgi:hypothetical protein
MFAVNYLLYSFFKHDGLQMTNLDGPPIDGSYLQSIYVGLMENKRLRNRYPSALQQVAALLSPVN